MLTQLGFLALAGAAGTLARYGLAGLSHRLAIWAQLPGAPHFPFGTLTVNLAGCFLFGLVWTLAVDRAAFNAQTKLLLLTGFMGAFTTFSTFAFETGELMGQGRLLHAAINLAAQNLLGIAAVIVGMRLARGA